MRRSTSLSLAGAIVALALGILVAGFASGFGHESRPASALDPLGQRSTRWLEQTLARDIPDRAVLLGTDEQMRTCLGHEQTARRLRGGCQALALERRILVRADYWHRLLALQRDGPRGDHSAAAFLLLHEELHRNHETSPGAIEEGAVDALAWDLLPSWSKAVFGVALRRPARPHYDNYVQIVRAASAEATGRDRNSREAIHWRRRLWAGDDAQREVMLREWASTLKQYDREAG